MKVGIKRTPKFRQNREGSFLTEFWPFFSLVFCFFGFCRQQKRRLFSATGKRCLPVVFAEKNETVPFFLQKPKICVRPERGSRNQRQKGCKNARNALFTPLFRNRACKPGSVPGIAGPQSSIFALRYRKAHACALPPRELRRAAAGIATAPTVLLRIEFT